MGWVVLSGSTGSSNTGPTAGNPDPYVYLESSGTNQTYGVGVSAGSSQNLLSNVIDASQFSSLSFSFDWNMNVDDNTDASLHVDVYNGSGWDTDVTGGAINTGNNGDVWVSEGPIDLSSYSNIDFQIRIRYVVGNGTIYRNDVAVDNLYISGTTSGGECTDGETRSCGSDVGECVAGTETCVNGQWDGVCAGEIGPSAETCDNLDNDCDGSIDENLTRGTTCGVGECGSTGVETCTAGTWGGDTCTPGTPAPDDTTCDGLDDDCDGTADEDNPQCSCVPTGVDEALCNGVDDDCDGFVDEDYPATPTTCGVGECSDNTGQIVCQNGTEVDTCDPYEGAHNEGPPGKKRCTDNLDNDCDGLTDEADADCREGGEQANASAAPDAMKKAKKEK
jgi:hypothetical protein